MAVNQVTVKSYTFSEQKICLTHSRAITLISLIITVIIILILAGVSINMIAGGEGLFSKTQTAVEKYQNAQEQEEALIAKISNSINSNRDDSEEIALLKQEIAELKKSIVPVGTIISYYGNTAPAGYLACDGTSKEVSKYKALAEFLGTDVETATSFNLPNLQGEFLRGAGTNTHANQGSGGVVRAHQDATTIPHMNSWSNGIDIQNFNVQLRDKYVSNYPSNEDIVYRSTGNTRWYLCSDLYLASLDQTNATLKQIYAYTSRPTNTSVLYCIKY